MGLTGYRGQLKMPCEPCTIGTPEHGPIHEG